jgi:hypothetical protein
VVTDKICAMCGRAVLRDDRFCAGCGTEFGVASPRLGAGRPLPSFSYHFEQGLAWGLGLGAAAVIFALVWVLVLMLARPGL